MGTSGSDSQAWLLTFASSLACILGSFFICFDMLVRLLPNHHDFDFQKDKRFLVGSLSLGSGVLVFTALNKILPEGLEYLRAKDKSGNTFFSRESYSTAALMAAFLGGVVLCIGLNMFLHRLTPESIVHCGDDEHDDDASEGPDVHEAPARDATHGRQEAGTRQNDEETPLLRKQLARKQSRSISFMRACKHPDSSECAGFTNPCKHDEVCCVHTKDAPKAHDHARPSAQHTSSHRSKKSSGGGGGGEHHHHITQERHDLMRIGFQTAIAISLHKVPEGFITFMANHRDASLGFSIFLALGIHNVVEGFTVAFPLYLAWQSRTKAILTAVALGGLSQPLGAVLAYAVTKTKFGSREESAQLDLAYGILFGATAGFMSVIAVSSMLPQAIRNDSHDGFLFTLCFFIGILVIGLSGALAE